MLKYRCNLALNEYIRFDFIVREMQYQYRQRRKGKKT